MLLKRLIVDTVVISNIPKLKELLELAKKYKYEIYITQRVQEEYQKIRGRPTLPTKIILISPNSADNNLIEKLLKRTLGKNAVTDWKKGRYVGNLGEIESIAIAKRLNAIFVSDDLKACILARVVLKGYDKAMSVIDMIKWIKKKCEKKDIS